MPDFTRWMNWSDENNLENWLDDANRAGGVAFMIGHRGVSVTLVRGASALPAQTVLLVPASGSTTRTTEAQSGGGVAGKEYYYMIGTRGHPDLDDFGVARGDRFRHEGVTYECTYVDKTMIGKTEARFEAMR